MARMKERQLKDELTKKQQVQYTQTCITGLHETKDPERI